MTSKPLGVSIPGSPSHDHPVYEEHKSGSGSVSVSSDPSPALSICSTCATPHFGLAALSVTGSPPLSTRSGSVGVGVGHDLINIFDRDIVRVSFIGAGGINFGSPEGPWNHSLRLETKLGQKLIVSHLVDPNQLQMDTVLHNKLNPTQGGPFQHSVLAAYHAASYAHTKCFTHLNDFLSSIEVNRDYPDIVLVGVPAAYHGSTIEGRNIEMKLAKALPHSVLFVDKPISLATQDQVMAVGEYLYQQNTLCSVGYFMRYLQCVQKVKELIQQYNINIMATVARYTSCYAAIEKPDWWIKSISGAPIVEQGTHFVDLSLYFGGRVIIPSIQAQSVEYNEPCGKLSSIPINENLIPPHERISRYTTAIWKYESGAVGSINYGINLHGTKFECELEIHGDGYLFIIRDPYDTPKLLIRTPTSDQFETIIYSNDDPYQSQMSALVDAAIKHREQSQQQTHTNQLLQQNNQQNIDYGLLCTWADACHTYEVTCVIRDECKPSTAITQAQPINATSTAQSQSQSQSQSHAQSPSPSPARHINHNSHSHSNSNHSPSPSITSFNVTPSRIL